MKTKGLKIILCVILALCVGLTAFVTIINIHVKSSSKDSIIMVSQASNLSDVDCILVLGCGVKSNGEPSDMLRDRLDMALELYNSGVTTKILMSGDHSKDNYDEVNTMKNYVVEKGVPSENVFMDHAGLSTYESIYRAKEIFEVEKCVIVTQKYHLYRALYLAEKFDIIALGVSADYHTYSGQSARDFREVLARIKDWFNVLLKPQPTYLGEKISLNTNGNVTNG